MGVLVVDVLVLTATTDVRGRTRMEEVLTDLGLSFAVDFAGRTNLCSFFIFCLAVVGVSMAFSLASRKAAASIGGW